MTQLNALFPVLYTETQDKEFLLPLLVYKARFLKDDSIEIIDFLGRGATLSMGKEEFNMGFAQITEEEFITYENYINNGNVESADAMLNQIKNKYVC